MLIVEYLETLDKYNDYNRNDPQFRHPDTATFLYLFQPRSIQIFS